MSFVIKVSNYAMQGPETEKKISKKSKGKEASKRKEPVHGNEESKAQWSRQMKTVVSLAQNKTQLEWVMEVYQRFLLRHAFDRVEPQEFKDFIDALNPESQISVKHVRAIERDLGT